MPDGQDVLTWLHIGDLHITRDTEQNALDLKRIVALARGLPAGSVDFALLPGDNADDGTPEQFRLVRDAVAHLPMPVHILPGDHDFSSRTLDDLSSRTLDDLSSRTLDDLSSRTLDDLSSRTLDAFHDVLGAERLPKAVEHGHHCLFLDVVSAGGGGPDFRLGEAQLAWAERELADAEAAGQDAVVFMHTYPADLREGRSGSARCWPGRTSSAWTWATLTTTSWPMTATRSLWQPARPGRSRRDRRAFPSPPSMAAG